METIVAEYPCCSKPCRIRLDYQAGRSHWALERRHFCENDDEMGTLWLIDVALTAKGALNIHRITFLDAADREAAATYGSVRIPRRRLNA